MTDLKECDEKLRIFSNELRKGKHPSSVMIGIDKLLDLRLVLTKPKAEAVSSSPVHIVSTHGKVSPAKPSACKDRMV